jgi:hypothetical protein
MRLAIVGTALALSALSAASTAEATPQPEDYSGEDLFMGLFLNEGPAAQAFSELTAPHSGVQWAPEEARSLTDRMKALDPAFFATLKADLTSGDRLRVRQAADAAGELAARAMPRTTAAGNPQGNYIVVHRTVMKNQHVVVNQNKYWNGPEATESELAHERWVDDVAQHLEQ